MAAQPNRPHCANQDNFTRLDFLNETWVKSLDNFGKVYSDFHQTFSIILAVFGVLSNVVFIVVLTRPSMISAINIVLTSIAACDSGLMLSHFIFLVRQLLSREESCDYKTEIWAQFSLFHANFGLFAHAGSLWLTVLMAFFRWYMLRDLSSFATTQIKNKIVIISIIATQSFVGLMCVPSVMSYSQYSKPHRTANCTVYTVEYSTTSYLHDCLLLDVHYWIGGIGFKMLPCFFLAVFMGLLLFSLYEAKKRRNRLLSSGKKHRNFGQDRTTLMLILILFIFWITELPQGILTVLGGYLGTWFIQLVYRPVGDVLDDLSLINSCVNFVLYCCMSSQFRAVFKRTFLQIRQYTQVPTTLGERPQMTADFRSKMSHFRTEPSSAHAMDMHERQGMLAYANGSELGEHDLIRVETTL